MGCVVISMCVLAGDGETGMVFVASFEKRSQGGSDTQKRSSSSLFSPGFGVCVCRGNRNY